MSQIYQLHSTHEEYRAANHPQMDVRQFVGMVCNNLVQLPQSKLQPQLHVPMVYYRRDGTGGDVLTYGHPTPDQSIEYVVVLPETEPSDILGDRGLTFDLENRCHRFVVGELAEAGIDYRSCAFTRAIRFIHPAGKKPGAGHKKSCEVYAQADVLACQPKAVIAFGAQALKALFGQQAKISSIRGNVLLFHDIPVIATDSPKAFMAGHAGISVMRSELRRAKAVAEGRYDPSPPSQDNYRVCSTVEDVRQLVADIRSSGSTEIAIDCEWGNDVGREEYSYTLSVQLCWAEGHAAFVCLRGEFGREIHTEEQLKEILQLLVGLLGDEDIQLIGHHLRVDVNQFWRMGYDIDRKVEDGFCTMLVHHLLYNDEMQGLDHLCRKYTPEFGAFWQDLEDWLDSQESRAGTLAYGFRDIPHSILVPYALRDADVTFRCAKFLRQELDGQPTLRDLYYNLSAPCALHLMDVERQGVMIDVRARKELLEFYLPVRQFYQELIEQELNWPGINPGSPDQLKTALYQGQTYSNAKQAPEGTACRSYRPLYNTDKYPKAWDTVEDEGMALYSSPSVGNATLEMLHHRYPDDMLLVYLRHFSAVNKLISNYLADPPLSEHGYKEDGKSLGCNIYEDGRARTRLSQITTTGRYTSSNANLQTWPNKQESALMAAVVFYQMGLDLDTYKKRLKEGEISEDQKVDLRSIKSCVIAPEGRTLIEVDFKTAELFVWAYMSGDPALIHVIDSGRNLHSENAARAFQLPELKDLDDVVAKLEAGDSQPYNEWADMIASKYKALRIAAKAIIFGVMYGRGARALAAEIGKTGVEITVDECQKIIDAIAQSYPVAWQMLERNAYLAVTREYVETAFGRRRMFTGVKYGSKSDRASAGRQAKNCSIQGTVADLLAMAGIMLYRFRYRTEVGRQLGFDIILPVHDAFLVEVDDDKLDQTLKALDLFMGRMNKLPGTDYHLGVDSEVMRAWGREDIVPTY